MAPFATGRWWFAVLVGIALALASDDGQAQEPPVSPKAVAARLEHPQLSSIDTLLAPAARTYFTAMAGDDLEAIRQWIEAHFTPQELKRRGADGWAKLHHEIAAQVPALVEFRVVENDPERLEVLTRIKETEDWLSWKFLAAPGHALLRGVTVVNAAAPDTWAPLFRKQGVESLARELRQRINRPAVAVVTWSPDAGIRVGVAGVRKQGGEHAAQPDDLFHIGSCTKTITALVLASCVEKRELSWSDTLENVFAKDFEIQGAYRTATLSDVARHRAGLIGHSKDIAEAIKRYADLPGTAPEQRARYLRDVLQAAPQARRGTTSYSNAGFCLLAHACERATGKAYEDLVRERVLAPLGITRSAFGWPATAEKPDGIWGHGIEDGAIVPYTEDLRLGSFLAPAGDLCLTPRDFAMVLSQLVIGPAGKSKIASAERFRELLTVAPGSKYAAGVGVARGHGRKFLTHTGSVGVHWARYRAWPSRNAVAAVLINGPVGKAETRIVDAALRATIGK